MFTELRGCKVPERSLAVCMKVVLVKKKKKYILKKYIKKIYKKKIYNVCKIPIRERRGKPY